ncbi:MAG: UDP-glucose/GDP-mannose dehydrogenase family protein [Candidatus Palauibacterales bacterium]|nr:UDP-glucose/GDP-mannose dehydrogenase family protein [Candidatus Palauibacterales bacterium]MDP2529872.1 UDP-glucose/GDP-mannose dehydrogenase family protein [Candidatus Palauibacterales bacterium]MDP2584730.1 UDP-glucose/GDP-mannose dehydrogenase family protein [Candidatus Palauibacterales bacterium]
MDVTVIGTGYVGLVVGACLAETGHRVVCADVDEGKIERLERGEVPIFEPGLDRLLERNTRENRLRFTTDVDAAAARGEVLFIAVGTPPDEDGSADLQHVLSVAGTIGRNLREGAVVITKSTVPVGTARRVREEIERWTEVPFHVCSNPEFLKEGSAVDDFMRPDRVVCGIETDAVRPILQELYEPFVRTGNPLLFMDIPSAELTKYAANAMLATRISFMNQVAALCEATGADVTHVRHGIGSDPRIGSSFLFAGAGYGGSCFPKDVRALIRTGDEQGIDLSILRAVHEANDRQKRLLVEKVLGHFGRDLAGRRLAVWGLAFKPETDDMREAPSIEIVEGLLEAGASVAVHDPVAMEVARARHFGDRVDYCDDEYEACVGADALVIVTEWLQYRRPSWERLSDTLLERTVFDGRNLFEPRRLGDRGFRYYPIGREAVE